MRDNRLELLQTQLSAALADLETGDGDAMEVAVLAGLLSRQRGESSELESAAAWRDSSDDLLDEALAAVQTERFVDKVAQIEEDEPLEVKLDALFDFDEFAAAAHWCAAEPLAERPAELIARLITAFHEPWIEAAQTATALLASAPPLAGDPARQVWEAVEAASFERRDEAPAASQNVPPSGFFVSVSLESWLPSHVNVAQAAGELEEAPPWQTLRREEGWELALTTDDKNRAVFQLHATGAIQAKVTRDGNDVPLVTSRPGVWTCEATPAVYAWSIGEHNFEVQIAP